MNFNPAPTTSTPSFNFSSTPSTGLTFGGSLTQPSASTAAVPATGFLTSSVPASSSITAGTNATSTLGGFGSTPVSKPSGITGFTIPTSATATSTAPAVDANKPAASLITATATTASAAAPASSHLNFCQLEELTNKWTLELEEQEKMFMNQATQVNSWDKVLIGNSIKLIALSEAVEKVKIDQQALEHELEFIAAQHTELDECITPLQAELAKQPHMDIEKAQTYILAESLDTQLRQMSEDLKEVIEHLNEANKVQDTNDPIVQIGRILNAHMTSLQWIESSASQVTTKIDDISKMYDSMRRDNERSFRLTYND